MKAAMPPAFWASAITCRAMVVLPEDSGPKISLTRPRGKPPTPKAASTEMEPVEITETGTMASFDPSRRIEPLPNCFSIWLRAVSNARARSFSSMSGKTPKGGVKGYCSSGRAAGLGRVDLQYGSVQRGDAETRRKHARNRHFDGISGPWSRQTRIWKNFPMPRFSPRLRVEPERRMEYALKARTV